MTSAQGSLRAARRSALLVCLLLLLAAVLTPIPLRAAPAAQQAPRVQVGEWKLDEVADWQSGLVDGLLISNNAGGELRLAENQTRGQFTSVPFPTRFPFNMVGATWRAQLPQDTTLALEVRGRRPLADNETLADAAGWSDWQPIDAGDARSQKDDGAYAGPDVLAFAKGSTYLQLRITFTSNVARASAILSSVNVSYLDAAQGVAASPGLPRGPLLYGPETLTPRPTLVLRSTWSARNSVPRPERATPRGIILHQIEKPGGVGDATSILRALATYQTEVLGWDDLSYHYVIDESGILYEGRLGGPASLVPRLAGGDTAIHIALIGSLGEQPSPEAQGTLVNLLAWLGQAFNIPPEGQHAVIAAGARAQRANIAGHNEAAPEARDPGQPLRDLLPQLRSRADQSTIRARWYFPEGNIRDYSERLVFFNPTGTQANATVTLLNTETNPATPISRVVPVLGERRADLAVNDLLGTNVLSSTTSLPTIVESSVPLIAERTLGLTTDIGGGPGINQLSRVWYFAEGSTEGDFRTFLVLFNPQTSSVAATITYMKSDGSVVTQQEQIPAQQRLVVTVGDTLLGFGFGVRIVASQPIAAERTMRFGADGVGLHIGRGINKLATRWYFAEGTTEAAFQMRLLLLNPNKQTANTTISFLKPDGKKETRRYAIPATTRLVVNVNDVVPDLGVATMVDADRPLAVERALYFRDGQAGMVSAGATTPAFTWRFAEGRSQDATYFLLFSNPNERAASVQVNFVFADGAPSTQQITMPPNSRYTMAVHEMYPNETAIAATVRATQPIVAERSFFPGSGERGGLSSLGVPGE